MDSIALHWTHGEKMIDTTSVTDLIERQIKIAIDQQVKDLMSNEAWIGQIEKKIIDYTQARIVGRFSNISTVPDLIDTVKSSVSKLFEEGFIPGISTYVNEEQVAQSIDHGVQSLVESAINNLVVDPKWISKIETQVNRAMTDVLLQHLNKIDINALLVDQIDTGINRWQDRMLQKFKTNGITDTAIKTELTVMDDAVVVENELVAANADIRGALTVQTLVVKGRINTDNSSWAELTTKISDDVLKLTDDAWRTNLIGQVLESARTSGITFQDIVIDGNKLLDGNKLNPFITETNIKKLGDLDALTVTGVTKLSGTLNVSTGRVGINTETPEMALSVWDEEVVVIAGKIAKQQAYIGTARLQNLSIGVNRIPQIEIDTDGLTTIKQLRLNRNKLSFAPEVPGYAGTRGDFVFNSDPKPDSPFGWVCLGSFQWQPLKGS